MKLADWTAVSLPSRAPPVVRNQADGAQEYHTKNSGGGLAYFFRPPLPATGGRLRFSWKWAVQKHPNSHPRLPLDKGNDDYALRVGVVLSDGVESMQVPSEISLHLKAMEGKPSYVVFYCAVRRDAGAKSLEGSNCGVSPYSDHILNCLIPVGELSSAVRVDPFADAARGFRLGAERRQALKALGLWTVADSDNTRSESDAEISGLQSDVE